MNTHNEPDEFERQAAALLRAGADELDGATRTRLARARANALEPRHAGVAGSISVISLPLESWPRPRWPRCCSSATTGTCLLSRRAAGAALYDMDLLADADALDIAQETDLDFVEWAAAQGEQDGAGG